MKPCRIRLFSSLPCLLLEGHAFFLRREIKLPRRLLSRLWAEPLHPAMIVGRVSWCIMHVFFQDSRPSLSNIIPSVHSLNAKCESFTKKSEFPPFQIPILSGNRWKSFECRAPFLRHLQLSCSSTSRIARRLQDLHLICWQFHSLLGLAKKLPKLTGLLGCLLVRIGIKDTNTEIFVLLIHVKFSTKYYIWLEILEWLSQICNRSICIISLYIYIHIPRWHLILGAEGGRLLLVEGFALNLRTFIELRWHKKNKQNENLTQDHRWWFQRHLKKFERTGFQVSCLKYWETTYKKDIPLLILSQQSMEV